MISSITATSVSSSSAITAESFPFCNFFSNQFFLYLLSVFDTGLKLELLQEYCLIALDVFRKFPYPKNRNEQTAWLSLLATEEMKDAEALVLEYPWLEEIYEEIAMLRKNPEEVLGMFSEALRILDRNTIKYMVEEMQKTIDEQKTVIGEKDLAIEERESELEEKASIINKQNEEIESLRKQLEKLSGER